MAARTGVNSDHEGLYLKNWNTDLSFFFGIFSSVFGIWNRPTTDFGIGVRRIWLNVAPYIGIGILKYLGIRYRYRLPTQDWSLAETALRPTCQIWCRSVHWCDLGACCWVLKESKKKEKKEKKARKETYSGKLGMGVRPDHPRWRSDIYIFIRHMWSCMLGGLREVVISFKFRQNRLNGFRDVEGRNLPFPIPKASGLYNSLYMYYRTSRDTCVHRSLLHYFRFWRRKRKQETDKCCIY